MKKNAFTILALLAALYANCQHRSTFEDLGLTSNSYWNGSSLSGGFLDGEVYFYNSYDTTYYSWSGFAYSNQPINVDTLPNDSTDYNYAYNSAAGAGATGSAAFGICYIAGASQNLALRGFAPGNPVYGFYITNTAYNYMSMKFGDHFSKKFGGSQGTDPDWFRLTISGWYNGLTVADSVQFYLADFRSPDTSQHYIVKNWQFINLLSLGKVDSLFFVLNSSDTGVYGMNTPAYFDLDNFLTTDGSAYQHPIAHIDSFAFQYLDTLTGLIDTLVANVVANDTLSPFFLNSVSLLSSPMIIGASAYINNNDSFVYIPAATGVQGVDSLYYQVCDELDSCSTSLILVNVLGARNTGAGIIPVSGLSFTLYPNPSTTLVHITSGEIMEETVISDADGRELKRWYPGRKAIDADISSLSPGFYEILVRTQNGKTIRPLLKQ